MERKRKKEYESNFCPYKLSYMHTPEGHERAHSGQRLFKCDACDFISKYKSNLPKHVRQYTGVKPIIVTHMVLVVYINI